MKKITCPTKPWRSWIILLLFCLVARVGNAKCGIGGQAHNSNGSFPVPVQGLSFPPVIVPMNIGDSTVMVAVSSNGGSVGCSYCKLDSVFWTFNGTVVTTPANCLVSSTYVAYVSGTYTVHFRWTEMSFANNDFTFIVGNITSVPENFLQNILNLHPNPFNDKLDINITVEHPSNLTYEIFDMYGKKVKTYTHNNFAGELKQSENFANLSAGVYFFQLTLDGETMVKKIIHQ